MDCVIGGNCDEIGMAIFSGIDNFESYGTGNLNTLNGGTGWSGAWSSTSGNFVVESGTVNTGTRAIGNTSNVSGGAQAQRTFTAASSGTIYVSMRASNTTGVQAGLTLNDGAGSKTFLFFNNTGGNISYWNGSSYTAIQAFTANTWYRLGIQWNSTNHANQFAFNIDNGSWTTWQSANGTFTTLDSVTLYYDATSLNFYWDDISNTYAPVAANTIAFDTSNYLNFTSTSGTLSYTCTGANRLLMVFTENQGGSDDVTGVTYNGNAMTQTGTGITVAGSIKLRAWYMFDSGMPASGSAANIVVSRSSSNDTWNLAASYTGVKQSSFPDASSFFNDNTSPYTGTITTIADYCWTVLVGNTSSSGTQTASTGSTFRRNNTSALFQLYDSNGAITPAGSTSMSYTSGVNEASGNIMLSFAPVPSPSGPVNVKTWNGVALASCKTINGVDLASVKTFNCVA